jgi:ferredoxin
VTYVIAEPCIGEKNGACVDVCPAGCIHTTPDAPQNYIDPDVCIECEQCVLVCPVNAVFLDRELPTDWQQFVQVNAEFFTRNKATHVFPDAEIARMFDAIQAYASRAGVSVAIALVDASGVTVAQVEMPGADACADDAERKAYTAMCYGLGTHELKSTSKPLWLSESAIDSSRVLMKPGGVPLIERGEALGAIGVAGAGAHDLLCAQAALVMSHV